MAFSDWSTTPILNAQVPGITWFDTPVTPQIPAINARQMMADIKLASSGWGPWVNAIDRDVTPDGADRSTEAQAAYDYAASFFAPLLFPANTPAVGYYAISINLSSTNTGIMGESLASTQFRPATTTGTVFTLTDVSGNTLPLYMHDFAVIGQGTLQGIGIDHYTTGAASSGRELVERVQFKNLDISVNRTSGNFLAWYKDVFFEGANYHFYNIGTSYSHSGDLLVSGGHIRGAEKAVFYLDSGSIDQVGKIVFDNVTIESNNGYVIFAKNVNVTRAGVPAPVMRNCWNEGNALGGSITVGGVTGTPVWGYFDGVGMWILDNTPPGTMTLINGSTVVTINSDITYSFASTIDATSSLIHNGTRWINYKNVAGFVRSVDHVDKGAGTAAAVGSWFETNALLQVAKVSGWTTVKRSDSSANVTYTTYPGGVPGATANAADEGIATLTQCQDLTMTGANTWDGPNSGIGTIASGLYLCWAWVGKLISGTAPTLRVGVATGYHVSLFRTISETDFVTLKGMVPLDAAVNYVGFSYVSTANCVIREGGWAIGTFTDLKKAMAFLNSPVFPK